MSSRPIAVFNAEPNVTPMIDVLLVLLITFMIVTAEKRKTMDASLAQPCAEACTGGKSIVLEVVPGQRYLVNQLVVRSSDLRAYLTSAYAGRPEKVIQVAGRPGVTYADVIGAMDIARSAGVRVIGIAPKETVPAPSR